MWHRWKTPHGESSVGCETVPRFLRCQADLATLWVYGSCNRSTASAAPCTTGRSAMSFFLQTSTCRCGHVRKVRLVPAAGPPAAPAARRPAAPGMQTSCRCSRGQQDISSGYWESGAHAHSACAERPDGFWNGAGARQSAGSDSSRAMLCSMSELPLHPLLLRCRLHHSTDDTPRCSRTSAANGVSAEAAVALTP